MQKLEKLAKLIRYFILTSTTSAGSGHPTSSLSATDLLCTLLFDGFFKYDLENPDFANNDRLIFSKGHASPLFYSLWAAATSDVAAAGKVSEDELLTLRKFGGRLEGHPTLDFPYTESSTGSLGQGLSIGIGMALNAKYIDKLSYKTFVLLGDSEMAEGSQWEAIQIAAYYKLDNLIGILDVNRLGQRGETMYGHSLNEYQKRVASFGWNTITIDGHSYSQINSAYKKALQTKTKPTMIIAKTIKGKGVSFLENKDGWHGKALSQEELKIALQELGEVDKSIRGTITYPPKAQTQKSKLKSQNHNSKVKSLEYKPGEMVATRKAYGNSLVRIFPKFSNMVVLDAEVSNSTYSEIFQKKYPDRFFEMFIAEQNMVGVALGLSRRGKIPFISTFAAFFTRAFDQIRMSQYSDGNIKFVGSHVGVSIGQDGASQMGLEDIAMFRTLLNSVVLYPSDAISCEKMVEEAAKHKGNVYIRTTRGETPIIYDSDEEFRIGGSKTHKLKVQSFDRLRIDPERSRTGQSSKLKVVVVAAGITLYEALAAQQELLKDNIESVVVDCYSIKPIDAKTLRDVSKDSKAIVVVEDHYAEGGIGEAVRSALFDVKIPIYSLAVKKMPKSGKPSELLDYEEISSSAIIKKVKELL